MTARGELLPSLSTVRFAQRNFSQSTRLDPSSAECWIGFGCSFAVCDENDQALAWVSKNTFGVLARMDGRHHHPFRSQGPRVLLVYSISANLTRSAVVADIFFWEGENIMTYLPGTVPESRYISLYVKRW